MTGREPEAAFIEIVERRRKGYEAPPVIVPNEVRINGVPLLVPSGESIMVHSMELSDQDPVKVTLTLWAKRVVIEYEEADG